MNQFGLLSLFVYLVSNYVKSKRLVSVIDICCCVNSIC